MDINHPTPDTNSKSNEQFKPIIGYEDRYTISNKGRVYSIKNQQYLKTSNRVGYPVVCLYETATSRRMHTVHRLVATHFIDNPDNKPQVNHIDTDRQNNHVTNLEWVTGAENTRHALKNGLIVRRGIPHKIKPADVLDIRRLHAAGTSIADIMKVYPVSAHTIRRIATFKSHLKAKQERKNDE